MKNNIAICVLDAGLKEEELINSNCIKIGNFQLKNGDTSKYYFDMKNIISHPELLTQIGDLIYGKLMTPIILI